MSDDLLMVIRYWGLRGSVAAPLTTQQVREKELQLIRKLIDDGGTQRLFGGQPDRAAIMHYLQKLPLSLSGTYGGDTTCIEIQAQDTPLIMIDAGTGSRRLGQILSDRLDTPSAPLNPLNTDAATRHDLHLLFTHYHWDHIQGLPFFKPLFNRDAATMHLICYGRLDTRRHIERVFKGQLEFPSFPVAWADIPCTTDYVELSRLDTGPITIGKVTIRYQELSHPGSVFAYAFDLAGHTFVIATDHEHKEAPDPRLVELATNAKILYYDAQYEPDEYSGGDTHSLLGASPKVDWGHSTYEWAVRTALAANVETVVLGHHEPLRDDFGIEAIAEKASVFKDAELQSPEHKNKTLTIVAGHQGMEQRIYQSGKMETVDFYEHMERQEPVTLSQ